MGKRKEINMKRIIYSVYLKTKNMIKSLAQFNNFHLMDDVIYNGKKCFINNGTRYSNEGVHLWDVLEKEWNLDGTRNKYYASDKELKRIFTLSNIKNALFYHYNWWRTCWYNIELNKMLSR